MTKRNAKKLSLSGETIRELSHELARVGGGASRRCPYPGTGESICPGACGTMIVEACYPVTK